MFEVKFAGTDIIAYRGDDYDLAQSYYVAYRDGAGEEMVFIDHSWDNYQPSWDDIPF